jgi:hypothetical protein
MKRPARAEIMRKQSGGDDNDGSERLETGGLHLRNRDGCGDVDGRDGGDGFAAQRMVGTTNGIEAATPATPAVIAPLVRRPKSTPVHELERYMRCQDCSQVRGYPYKRSQLVAR